MEAQRADVNVEVLERRLNQWRYVTFDGCALWRIGAAAVISLEKVMLGFIGGCRRGSRAIQNYSSLSRKKNTAKEGRQYPRQVTRTFSILPL